MAYNLESLIRILQKILNPDNKRWIHDEEKPQIEFLLKKASSLKQVLENSPSSSTQSLGIQIRDAAHKAEDILESHMVDHILSKPEGESFTFSLPDLQEIIQELDSAMENAMKIVDRDHLTPDVSFSLPPDSSSKNIVVGLDEDLIRLKHFLTGLESKLEIIPIVGMGGIGKTTLARKLYNDPLILSHFDTCAWITISQDYNVRAILLGLLSCLMGNQLSDKLLQQSTDELSDILYKRLYGRRYLIVLDDIWSIKAWDDLKLFFPYKNNGSRIMLTTRELNVAEYVDSRNLQHKMHLLNESRSWNLLQREVFGKENCPAELVSIGRNIVSSCRGLPLAIHVIGGLLSKDKRRKDLWERVANDARAAIVEEEEQFSNILSLSYNHLPDHLKPCFLYMGAFPGDFMIRVSRIKRLWVAEGFLKSSNGDKTLEEEAEDCLKALLDRNLVSVGKWKWNGKVSSYAMHDLMRDLCVRKAGEEKFLYVKNGKSHNAPDSSICSLRRVSVHPSYHNASTESMSFARTLLCIGEPSHDILSPIFFSLRLLRVLDVYDIEFHQFPTEILQLVNLRYLVLFCNSDLPSTILRLWNLETLFFYSKSFCKFPSEIWEMSELRHVKFYSTLNKYYTFVIRIDPDYKITFVQEKLQTISYVKLDGLINSGLLQSIPNIKKLGIYFPVSPPFIVDLCHLHKLETLKCFSDVSAVAHTFLFTLRFPHSIRKLDLRACVIPWGFMAIICELPNLEVLKICKCVFESRKIQRNDEEEWEATEGEVFCSLKYLLSIEWEATEREVFCSLKYLLLNDLNLVHWRADETNFPRLRRLVIVNCSSLEEIPDGIGEIPTLKYIILRYSSPSAVASAIQILENQRESENYDLCVCVDGTWRG